MILPPLDGSWELAAFSRASAPALGIRLQSLCGANDYTYVFRQCILWRLILLKMVDIKEGDKCLPFAASAWAAMSPMPEPPPVTTQT
jgi:hypothetical protein